ncbi:hypothetical protein V8G54_015303, partial [Vigna mungo]
VTGFQILFFNEPAPTFGQNVALATIPIRVAESPHFPRNVFEVQQNALRRRRANAVNALQREVLLRVLLRDHQPIQLPHVTRRNRLLEQLLPRLYKTRASDRITGSGCGGSAAPPYDSTAALALLKLVIVRVFPEHVDDFRLGMRVEKLGLAVLVVALSGAAGYRLEVGNRVLAAEALRGDVVCPGRLVFLVEGSQPHALVLLVNLGTPAAVGLRHDAFVL